MNKYVIYTDGAYSPKHNVGGIGFIILKDDYVVGRFGKAYLNTTNQRMELRAAIEGLRSCRVTSEIILMSDSAYLTNTYNYNWKRKKNLDLWNKLDKEINKHKSVKFIHVKGHSNEKRNCQSDFFATEATRKYIAEHSNLFQLE